MGLLYPWATKEYLLWQMSFPQIIFYHNLGVELKHGKQSDAPKKAKDMRYDELKAVRDELRKKYGAIGDSPSKEAVDG